MYKVKRETMWDIWLFQVFNVVTRTMLLPSGTSEPSSMTLPPSLPCFSTLPMILLQLGVGCAVHLGLKQSARVAALQMLQWQSSQDAGLRASACKLASYS